MQREVLLPASGATTVQAAYLADKTIVLDPGHSGYDPGVMANNVEKKR